MYADTDSIQVHPLTNTGKARQMVRELLATPDPWDGITDDGIDYEGMDYTSSYPTIEEVDRVISEVLQWIADYEERKRRESEE